MTVDKPANLQNSSEAELQQLSKEICNRCRELNLLPVVKRTESALRQGSCIGMDDEDVQVLLQRVLFDLDCPLVQDCSVCDELERASRDGFKFNAPSSRRSTVGRNEYWFEFKRKVGLLVHYSLVENKTSDYRWKSIDYFGIATATSFPIGHSARPYTARKVSLQIPDFPLLLKWLTHCSRYHEACRPCSSDGLRGIYLIDVKTRSLVRYPGSPSPPVDYLALSYVWGDTPIKSFALGPLCDELPATIEDAIRVTQSLQKQYLWVDYVCIDQQDPERQEMQIKLMDEIYNASWATIISLDGITASEGLPRVGTSSQVKPQKEVDFGRGNSLLAMLPSIQTKLDESCWMKRGWTFQEGLLSNRRLFFAREQVYFVCNDMTCSESFNFVDTDGNEDPRADDLKAYCCSLRRPVGLDTPSREPQRLFEEIINGYILRELTHSSDAMNAVTGLLERLQKVSFPDGFIFGIPRRNFRYSLLWTGNFVSELHFPTRTSCKLRNEHFPSWSWAGWIWSKPVIWIVEPCALRCDWCRIFQPPLHLWIETGEEINPDALEHCAETPSPLLEPPTTMILDINIIINRSLPLNEIAPIFPRHVGSPGMLIVQGLVLQLDILLSVCKLNRPFRDISGNFSIRKEVKEHVMLSHDCHRALGQTKFEYCGQKPNKEFLTQDVPQRVDFLLVAFSYTTKTGTPPPFQENEDFAVENEVIHYETEDLCLHLLLLQWKDNIAFRVGMAALEIPSTNILRLQATNPRMMKFRLG
ncbi:hypothetical protein EG329_011025 [Mollisiaceae sp. DMI_Dod_QoI]|nr:hypothetical protein EG329_011025 [Helotiales sp. DMI_Dod_QoI]